MSLRLALLVQHKVCQYCGVSLKVGSATLDHVIPKSRGGDNSNSNLVLCCQACNLVKADRTLDEWIEDLQTAKAFIDGGLNIVPVNRIQPKRIKPLSSSTGSTKWRRWPD